MRLLRDAETEMDPAPHIGLMRDGAMSAGA